jgi:hypothetical protein
MNVYKGFSMRTFFFVFLFSVLNCRGALALEKEPRIEKNGTTYKLVLSVEMKSKLNNMSPSFKQYAPNEFPETILKSYKFSDKQMLSAVIGDFNGDGILDAVVEGADKDGDVTFHIISKKASYEISNGARFGNAKEIPPLYFAGSKWKYGMQYLEFRPPGAIFPGVKIKGRKDQCPTDGIAQTSNADGDRTMTLCWVDGRLTWDGLSGD